MGANDDKSGDLLGIRPGMRAVEIVAEATVAGVGAFLSRICLPAAEEFGFLLQDKVRAWRTRNVVELAQTAEAILARNNDASAAHADPRIVGAVLEHGSWVEESDIQNMWAGLLATSCTSTGRDQSNLVFVNLLSQLTTAEARLLAYACSNAPKTRTESGLLISPYFSVAVEQLVLAISSDDGDLHALDIQIDHLRNLGLLDQRSGISPFFSERLVAITPTGIALHMFARCSGHRGSPFEFFKI